jgi:hypothetical protein
MRNRQVEESMFFFEKKNQKTFPGRVARNVATERKSSAPQAFQCLEACGARARCTGRRASSNGQKFFASFFQKRSAVF